MQAQIERRVQEQRAEDLRRLADKGEANGVKMLVTRDGTHIATSASEPTRAYVVSAAGGCQCKGYAYWGRCQHHSLLLSELGLISDLDDDELIELVWAESPAPRPLEWQYVRSRVPHPRLPAGQLAPVA